MRIGPALLLSTCSVSLLAACGGAAGEAVRPQDLTGAEALGGAVSCVASKEAEPLLVDLPPEMRGELEAQLRRGVAVVSYDCKSLRVLDQCRMDGGYRFSGWSMKSNVVRMSGRDELSANLPLSSVKLGGAVESGRSIELALLNIGSQATTVSAAPRDRLAGECAGATHFVKKAYLGAFSMATSSSGKASTAVDLFGKVGVAGQSEAERNATSSDGSLDACKTADPAADKAPAECNVPVRAVLVPLGPGQAAPAAANAGNKDGDTPRGPELTADVDPCPQGFQLSAGACRKSATTHLCATDDQADCAAQCAKGDAGSCFNLGVIKYVAEDNAGAKAAFEQGCTAGHVDACGGVARASYPAEVKKANFAANQGALELSKKACNAGSPIGCWDAYVYLHDAADNSFEEAIDYGQALKFAIRACDLGEADGCVVAGTDLLDPPEGAPFKADPGRGVAMLQAGCDGGDVGSCSLLAENMYAGRSGVKTDVERAAKLDRLACDLDPRYCALHVDPMLQAGKAPEAFAQVKRACELNKEVDKATACKRLADFYAAGTGVAKDAAAAKDAQKRAKEAEAEACSAGHSAWCAKK